jgi:hypothetical protein
MSTSSSLSSSFFTSVSNLQLGASAHQQGLLTVIKSHVAEDAGETFTWACCSEPNVLLPLAGSHIAL